MILRILIRNEDSLWRVYHRDHCVCGLTENGTAFYFLSLSIGFSLIYGQILLEQIFPCFSIDLHSKLWYKIPNYTFRYRTENGIIFHHSLEIILNAKIGKDAIIYYFRLYPYLLNPKNRLLAFVAAMKWFHIGPDQFYIL